ncbi:SUMO-specific isopeptidase USPL1-like [Saccoglossus kowalevskii]|uniref:SUMO-specific isopeptidase USPL1-like n=1 Tax=Saccoglossus kowalevskii TaxID=10224 RepID=A0ABM0MEC5_SACKO|nr:PREDICTED: SUMO-specific isopeptidase USPL1-like [Saccoglossus kowalevskii]
MLLAVNMDLIQWCPLCERKGIKKRIKLFQVNLEEALSMCENSECPYPLGTMSSANILIQRKASEIANVKRKKRKRGVEEISFRNKKLAKGPGSVCSEVPSVSDVSSVVTTSELDDLLEMLNNDTFETPTNTETECTVPSVDNIVQFPSDQSNDYLASTDASPVSSAESTNTVRMSASNSIPVEKKPFRRKDFKGYVSGEKSQGLEQTNSKTGYRINMQAALQWQNRDALCWLDVLLCLLAHNRTLQKSLKQLKVSGKSLVKELCDTYNKAIGLMPQGDTKGAEFGKVNKLLADVQHKVWSSLKPKMRCRSGQAESPVFALPLLLKQNTAVQDLFLLKYHWDFVCQKCNYKQVNHHEKMLPTFPNVCDDFNLYQPGFLRPCYRCNTTGQKSTMKYDRLPPCIVMHFVEGLPSADCSQYTFTHDEWEYVITSVVEYRDNHFIAWCRDIESDCWLKCDDLDSPLCQWSKELPNIKPNEIHMVLWERQDTGGSSRIVPQHKVTTDQLLDCHKTNNCKNTCVKESSTAMVSPILTDSLPTSVSKLNAVSSASAISTSPHAANGKLRQHTNPTTSTQGSHNVKLVSPETTNTISISSNRKAISSMHIEKSYLRDNFITSYTGKEVIVTVRKNAPNIQTLPIGGDKNTTSGNAKFEKNKIMSNSHASSKQTNLKEPTSKKSTQLNMDLIMSSLNKKSDRITISTPRTGSVVRAPTTPATLQSSAKIVPTFSTSRTVSLTKVGHKKEFAGYLACKNVSKSDASALPNVAVKNTSRACYNPKSQSTLLIEIPKELPLKSTSMKPNSVRPSRCGSISFSDQSSPSTVSECSSVSSRDDAIHSIQDELCRALDITDGALSAESSRLSSPIDEGFLSSFFSDDASKASRLMDEIMDEIATLGS